MEANSKVRPTKLKMGASILDDQKVVWLKIKTVLGKEGNKILRFGKKVVSWMNWPQTNWTDMMSWFQNPTPTAAFMSPLMKFQPCIITYGCDLCCDFWERERALAAAACNLWLLLQVPERNKINLNRKKKKKKEKKKKVLEYWVSD